MSKIKYGKYIYEYIQEIHLSFEKLNIKTVEELRKELERRVKKYLFDKYSSNQAENFLNDFIKSTRDQQCSKVVINDFKRWNFTVIKPISKFNLFYYNQHLQGFDKNTVRDQKNLQIKKFDKRNCPNDLVVYWIEHEKKKKAKLKDFI